MVYVFWDSSNDSCCEKIFLFQIRGVSNVDGDVSSLKNVDVFVASFAGGIRAVLMRIKSQVV